MSHLSTYVPDAMTKIWQGWDHLGNEDNEDNEVHERGMLNGQSGAADRMTRIHRKIVIAFRSAATERLILPLMNE